MLKIVTAISLVLISTATQAEIICTEHGGCRETGVKLILVAPSHVNGQPMVSHRNGTPQTVRNLGRGEEMTNCQYCNRRPQR
jgi:hypothetical protein